MNSFVRGLAAALACAPLLAGAVSLDPQGLGQALIFPYYTVRSVDGDAFNTFVSIVNTTSERKALRVRFREGRNSREVASFNLFLGGGDMWTGAVVPFGGGAQLVTADRSCTSPGFADFAVSALPFMNFNNASYTGANADGAGDGLDRTLEGFAEVIEMATLTASAPTDCEALRAANGLPSAAPSGGLSGTLTLINVASGMDFTVNAEALADLASQPFYRPSTDPYPDFSAAEIDPHSSGIVNGKAYRAVWDRGVDAVSSVLMAGTLVNEYVVENATRSRSDWIVTFPTRRFYGSGSTVQPPFSTAVGGRIPPCTSQEIPIEEVFDRETRSPGNGGAGFTLPPPAPAPTCIPWSVTAFAAVNGSPATVGPLGSVNLPPSPIDLPSNFQAGWARFTFPEAGSAGKLTSRAESEILDAASGTVTPGSIKFTGLPVVGFLARTFKNGNLTCGAAICQGNYGGAFPHRYTRDVRPAP
jgi:hypothetical protein